MEDCCITGLTLVLEISSVLSVWVFEHLPAMAHGSMENGPSLPQRTASALVISSVLLVWVLDSLLAKALGLRGLTENRQSRHWFPYCRESHENLSP